MKTRVTEMSGIEHPVVPVGMHFIELAELARSIWILRIPMPVAWVSVFERFRNGGLRKGQFV